MNFNKKILTTSNGAPVSDNQNSLTVGSDGPTLIQDTALIEKLAKFDRERIPERVVHAKGAGAHGYFEVTHDVTKYTKANFLNTVGKKTPLFTRFSTVGGEKGSADTARDPRGFAVKFYTDEGIYDMVGNNTPIFFIRDAIKFPDFIHTQKRNPQTNLKDPNAMWDFFSLVPESVHQVTILFSNRGTPYGFRHMHGFSSHTFKWVNSKGEVFFVKYHFITDAGIKNFSAQEAGQMEHENPDFATQELFDHIQKGEVASWTVSAQIMPEADAANYRFNVFDVTKVWPHKDYPLNPFGKMVLNRNPDNYFAEVEQAAFSPGNFVPGIEATPDKMLQGRLFSYPDTHRHRLGANFDHIPINCPYRARVDNYYRDGPMNTTANKGPLPNYEPNSYNGPVQAEEYKEAQWKATGPVDRQRTAHPNDDFVQPGALFRDVLNDKEKKDLIVNIVNSLKHASKDIQERQAKIFYKCDPDYGNGVALGLGLSKIGSAKL